MKRAISLPKIEVDTPSKVGPAQVFMTEPISNVIGGPRRHRNINEHPLTLAWYKGRITDVQYAAGNIYRSWYERKIGTLKSCLNINIIAPKFGKYDLSNHQLSAGELLSQVNEILSRRDRIIIEKLCGEGYTPNESIKAAGIDAPKGTTERVSEALSELVLALKVVLSRKQMATPD